MPGVGHSFLLRKGRMVCQNVIDQSKVGVRLKSPYDLTIDIVIVSAATFRASMHYLRKKGRFDFKRNLVSTLFYSISLINTLVKQEFYFASNGFGQQNCIEEYTFEQNNFHFVSIFSFSSSVPKFPLQWCPRIIPHLTLSCRLQLPILGAPPCIKSQVADNQLRGWFTLNTNTHHKIKLIGGRKQAYQ